MILRRAWLPASCRDLPCRSVYFTACLRRSIAYRPQNGNEKRKKWPRYLLWTMSGASIAAVGLFNPFTAFQKEQRLSSAYFVPLTITSIEKTSDDTSIFTLNVPTSALPDPGQHPTVATPLQSIYVKQDDMQIQRPYTPLDIQSLCDSDGPRSMRILVKRYEDGEMSKWLHRRKIGDAIGIRGPVPTWKFDAQVTHLVFVRGSNICRI